MENQLNRLITYPSTVEKNGNHTVVLVDCKPKHFGELLVFLKTSKKNFDVYVYTGDKHDLEWLSYIGDKTDAYLIDDESQVKITPTSIRYGQGLEVTKPLDYFEKIEQSSVDTVEEKVL